MSTHTTFAFALAFFGLIAINAAAGYLISQSSKNISAERKKHYRTVRLVIMGLGALFFMGAFLLIQYIRS